MAFYIQQTCIDYCDQELREISHTTLRESSPLIKYQASSQWQYRSLGVYKPHVPGALAVLLLSAIVILNMPGSTLSHLGNHAASLAKLKTVFLTDHAYEIKNAMWRLCVCKTGIRDTAVGRMVWSEMMACDDGSTSCLVLKVKRIYVQARRHPCPTWPLFTHIIS